MSDKNSTQILLSSTLATTIVGAFTNPIDVVKVRLQNAAKACNIEQPQCVDHSHSHTHKSPNHIRQASLYKLFMTPNLKSHYNVLCDCLPFRSTSKALVYIIRKEGFRTLMNGLGHGLIMSVLSQATYYSVYEGVRKHVKQVTSNPIGIPLVSALAARTLTCCITFPFEYWRTLQQSVVGGSAKAGFRLGMKINSGFFSLLQRDLIFSGLYWILVENIRNEVKSWSQVNEEGYLDKRTLLLSNIIAGSTSGAICAIVTLPLDVVKTRRQLHPKEYKNRSTWNILREIYYKEGSQSVLAGMRQRITKVTISCAGFLTLYEFFSDALKDRKY